MRETVERLSLRSPRKGRRERLPQRSRRAKEGKRLLLLGPRFTQWLERELRTLTWRMRKTTDPEKPLTPWSRVRAKAWMPRSSPRVRLLLREDRLQVIISALLVLVLVLALPKK
jgi:hypothetical protein